MKTERMRHHERELGVTELRAHLLADHRLVDEPDYTWLLDSTDRQRMLVEHGSDHNEIDYGDLPPGSSRVSHFHLPRIVRLPQDTRSMWPVMSITTAGEGWEFLYSLIGDLVTRQLSVRINSSPDPVTLVELIGDLHTSEMPAPYIIARQWNEVQQDYVGDEGAIAIPLFNEDGTCHIWQVEIL